MNLIHNYFFVPANKQRFLEKSLELEGIDSRVLDFEDSVSSNELEKALNIIQNAEIHRTDWIRIPVIDEYEKLAKKLFNIGLTKVVIPKVRDKNHIDTVMNKLLELNDQVKVIILVENAKTYLQLGDILNNWSREIEGIGLGSHDFSAVTKIQHNTQNLLPIRLQISLLANAYDLTAIDIASMNISDEELYKSEIQSAYDLGYRSKFVLHPFQLHLLNQYSFFTKEEVNDAIEVLKLFHEKEDMQEVVVKYKGEIYEKPHIENIKDIKAWGEQHYGTDR